MEYEPRLSWKETQEYIADLENRLEQKNKIITDLIEVAEFVCNDCPHKVKCFVAGKDTVNCKSWQRIVAARNEVKKE